MVLKRKQITFSIPLFWYCHVWKEFNWSMCTLKQITTTIWWQLHELQPTALKWLKVDVFFLHQKFSLKGLENQIGKKVSSKHWFSKYLKFQS